MINDSRRVSDESYILQSSLIFTPMNKNNLFVAVTFLDESYI